MANCDLDQLIEDASCLNCLSESEKQDATIAYLALALDDIGGPDYTDLNTLREAVACWCTGGQVLDSFMARVAINLAVNTGAVATVPTIAEVREVTKCYQCDVGGDEKKAMQILLLCLLFEQLVIT